MIGICHVSLFAADIQRFHFDRIGHVVIIGAVIVVVMVVINDHTRYLIVAGFL